MPPGKAEKPVLLFNERSLPTAPSVLDEYQSVFDAIDDLVVFDSGSVFANQQSLGGFIRLPRITLALGQTGSD